MKTILAVARAARRLPSDVARWSSIARGRAITGETRVFYGHEQVPRRDEPAHGGMIKFQSLAETFPNSPRDFNVLYLGSSTLPEDAAMLVRLAHRRGAVVAWNQNGVAYPGWHGPGWRRVNARRARLLHEADHVFYQSEFCKLSADRFYGEREGPSEVLYNPVDTERFAPGERPDGRPTLLLGGNQYQRYRFETALHTLARLPREWRLLVLGTLSWHPDAALCEREAVVLVEQAGISERVDLLGPYTQADAPELMRLGHILLHTKYNDPCPTVVLEAMASGLPVVYSASGGVPELVGEDAGLGVDAPLDWEHDHPPDPVELADAVLHVEADLDGYSRAARSAAVERFDLRPWVDRHRSIFEELQA